MATPAAAQLDWVHLARRSVEPARVADLVADVSVERTPRRALAFYAPTRLAAVMVMPPSALWTASLAAESPRGGVDAPAPVTAVLRAEADGEAPIEERVEVTPNRPWHESRIDLSSLAGKPVRLSVAAEGSEAARLAVAAPSLRYRAQLGAAGAEAPRPPRGAAVRRPRSTSASSSASRRSTPRGPSSTSASARPRPTS